VTPAKAQSRNRISKKPDQSLPRSKILRGKLNYQRLFKRSTVLKSPPLLCRYRVYADPSNQCLFGFIAPKKIFRRAVDRNKAKRYLREAFRIHQNLLPDSVKHNDIGFHAVFIATGKDLSYSTVEKQMIKLLESLSIKLTSERTSANDNNDQKTD